MSASPNLALPFLAADQAQKHVTLNEALRLLDALTQLVVEDRDLAAPPPSPVDGRRWIVAGTGSDAWAGHGGHIAIREDGAWRFVPPGEGWLAFVRDESVLVHAAGGFWAPLTIAEAQNLTRLGIGTTADATNPFAAKLNKLLFTAKAAAEGGDGDLRCTFNKETAADVLSLLFQSDYSGRAEIGLIGDNDLVLKLSADGSSFVEAMRLRADGRVGIGTASPLCRLDVDGPVRVKSYTVATVPAASGLAGAIIFVSNESGGGVLAFSDGATWRRVTDRAVVS